MPAGFPRIYRSFAEFEHEELRKLDSLRTTIDDLVEEHFNEEADLFDDADDRSRRRRRR